MGSTDKRSAATWARALLDPLPHQEYFGTIDDLSKLSVEGFWASYPTLGKEEECNTTGGRTGKRATGAHDQTQDGTLDQLSHDVQEAPRSLPPIARQSNARTVRTPPLKKSGSGAVANSLLGKPFLNLYYSILNQPTTWTSNRLDLLARFDDFRANQVADEQIFNMSRDDICDLTSDGEFFKTLGLPERKAVNQNKPNLPNTHQLKSIMDELFEPTEGRDPTFEQVFDRIRSMDHKDDLVQYVSFVLTSMEPCFHHEQKTNEHQYFSEFILPALSRSFLKHGLRMETFEVTLLGSQEKNYQGRDTMNETDTASHKADAVVNADECQVMIVKSSKRIASKEERQGDHYRLSRNMKNTWIHSIGQMVQQYRMPEQFTTYGIHVHGDRMSFRGMDFQGCFRLFEISECLVPVSRQHFKDRLPRFLRTCLAFASLVRSEVDRRRAFREIPDKEIQEMKFAVDRLDTTCEAPPKSKKRKVAVS